MPGSRLEYDNALEEGAQFVFLVSPVAALANGAGKVHAVRCVRMELGAPDASGRRRPQPIPGSEHDVPADMVLVSYGFDPVAFPAGSDFAAIARHEWGGMIVDQHQMTSLAGVFAGGDLVRGPSLVVHAVRDARKAAQGIHRYLAPRRLADLGLAGGGPIAPGCA
jgi:glutamate synthase (NADPH/NADH) small chain